MYFLIIILINIHHIFYQVLNNHILKVNKATFNLPDSSGRVLQGVDNDHSVGTTIEAGLPNITGEFIPWSGKSTYDLGCIIGSPSTGAIKGVIGNRTTVLIESPNSGLGTIYAEFDASLSNPIYSKSSTVQPPALTINFCIKY